MGLIGDALGLLAGPEITQTAIRWDTGWIELDASIREEPEHRAELTEHPVEEGAAIVDHVRPIPFVLHLEAIVTDTPTRVPRTHTDGAKKTTDGLEIPKVNTLPGPLPKSVAGVPIEWPSTQKVDALKFDAELKRSVLVYDELVKAMEEARLFTITTTRRDYDNLILRELSAPRDAGNANTFTFTALFQQVTFAASEFVAIEAVKNGGKKPKNKKSNDLLNGGRQAAGAAGETSKSIAADVLDSLTGG